MPSGLFFATEKLMILTPADSSVTALTDGSHYDNFPQWFPKGDAIMFNSDREGRFELYTMRPDGGANLRGLTNVPGGNAPFHLVQQGRLDCFQKQGRMPARLET